MTVDPDSREISINYDGGSIVMSIGNAKSLFGEDSSVLRPTGVETNVSVRQHTRVRVIGGPSKTIEPYQYTYKQWPVGSSSLASGGEPIMMAWEGSEGWWTARMSGSAWELGEFLNSSAPVPVTFKTEAGTPYGPFVMEMPQIG